MCWNPFLLCLIGVAHQHADYCTQYDYYSGVPWARHNKRPRYNLQFSTQCLTLGTLWRSMYFQAHTGKREDLCAEKYSLIFNKRRRKWYGMKGNELCLHFSFFRWNYLWLQSCVLPPVFLLVAQRVHCCFWPQSRNCSSKVFHPLVGYFHSLLWNGNII